jgi:hypothetical protein
MLSTSQIDIKKAPRGTGEPFLYPHAGQDHSLLIYKTLKTLVFLETFIE